MGVGARAVFAAIAAGNLVLAMGLAVGARWALRLVPVELGPLSRWFFVAILAAIVAGALWIVVSGEYGAVAAGTLDLTVTMLVLTVAFTASARQPGRDRFGWYALGAALLVALNAVLFLWAHRRAATRAAPTLSRPARATFATIVAILLTVGTALLLRTSGVLPWPVSDDVATLIGAIFFGNAWYFAYAVSWPTWDRARGPLWSFLAYDLVLLGPLLAHRSVVSPELRTNLRVYIGVLVVSAAIAVRYLVLDRVTRGWGTSTRRQASSPAASR